MKKLGILVAAVLLSAVGALALGGSASAVRKMTMSPVRSEHINLSPSMVETRDFMIYNTGDEPIEIEAKATPMCVNEQYTFTFEGCTVASSTTMHNWITVSIDNASLAPGAETKVRYTITVPPTGLPGGSQHAGVTVKFAGSEGTLQAEYTLGFQVFAINPIGARVESKLVSTKVDRIQFKRPLSARAQARNDGNVDFFVKTTMTVKTLGGKEVDKSERNHVVLPGTTREVASSWDGAPHLGLFKVKYDVVLESLDGKILETKTIERTVLMIPLFLFVVILVVIAALIVFLVMRVRKGQQLKSARRY